MLQLLFWCTTGACYGAAAASSTCYGIFPALDNFSKSLRVIRPSFPEPSTSDKSIPFSCESQVQQENNVPAALLFHVSMVKPVFQNLQQAFRLQVLLLLVLLLLQLPQFRHLQFQLYKRLLQLLSVSPSCAINSLMTPVKEEGTSAVTLSVFTSASGSYLFTVSPVYKPFLDCSFCYTFPELRHYYFFNCQLYYLLPD